MMESDYEALLRRYGKPTIEEVLDYLETTRNIENGTWVAYNWMGNRIIETANTKRGLFRKTLDYLETHEDKQLETFYILQIGNPKGHELNLRKSR